MLELSEEKPRLRPVCFVIARLISLNLVPAARLVGPASPSGVAPLLSSNGLPEWLILAPSCLFPANGGRCWAFAPASRLPPDTGQGAATPPLPSLAILFNLTLVLLPPNHPSPLQHQLSPLLSCSAPSSLVGLSSSIHQIYHPQLSTTSRSPCRSLSRPVSPSRTRLLHHPGHRQPC